VLEPDVPPAAPLPVPVAPVPELAPVDPPPAPAPGPTELPCPPGPPRSLAEDPVPDELLDPRPVEPVDVPELLDTVPERALDEVPVLPLLSPPRSCSQPRMATPFTANAAAVRNVQVFRMGGTPSRE